MASITEILMEQNPIYNRQALGQTLPTMKEKLAVRPSKSKYTIAAEGMQTPDATLGYVKGGNLLTAITNGLKSGFGFYGAMQDRKAEQEYNQALADLAAKEREDKLAQQAFENDYKDRELAQKAELAQGQYANQRDIAQMQIDADALRAKQARENALIDAERQRNYAIEDRNYKTEQEQAIYDRNRADALSDMQTKQDYEKALYQQKGIDAQNAELLKNLDAIMQKRLTAEDYAKWRQNPNAYDVYSRAIYNPARWFGKANYIEQKDNAFTQVSNEDLLKGL